VFLGKPAVPHWPDLADQKECRGLDREDQGLLSRYPARPRRRLTVDECHRMGEAGILPDDDRVELIGKIFD
jgi:hypothetical protein